VLVVAAGVAVDQTTKAVSASMRCGTFVCPQRNGALMLGVPAGSVGAAIAASVMGLVVFALWVRLVRRWAELSAWPLGLVIAGIVSNLADRVLLGSVRDFLAGPGDTLVNLADLFLGVGVLWCVVLVVIGRAHLLREQPLGPRFHQEGR